jgi:hypothetical protein
VLAEDGSARYGITTYNVSNSTVAEDNIWLVEECSNDSISTLCNLNDIGRYFRRFDTTEGRFIPNSKVAIEYPDS